jgi:branched-chain amino acid transport system substrate-binding protein
MVERVKRIARQAIFGVVLVGLLAACAPAAAPTPTPTKAPAAPKEPIKIGFVNSFSGYMGPMGTPERDAVLMLEEKVNKEGGINGRPLKVIVYDDESDESKGVLAVKKLIEQDKVLGIIGTSASGIAMAEVPIAEKAKVPWVTMQSAKATVINKKWIFKLPLSEGIYIQGIYKWLKDQGFTKFAWLSQGAGFGRQARKYMQNTVTKAGLTAVVDEEYGPKDTDMKPQLTKVKASDAQALVIYGAEPAGAIAVRQAKEIGLTIPVIGPESLTLPAIMSNKQLREGLEGLYILGHKADVWEQLPDSDPQKAVLKDLAAQLKAKYGPDRKLSMWESVAHDAFMVMVNAIKRADPDPTKLEEARAKIRDAIEQTKGFLGATSPISYTPTEHEILDIKAAVISQIKGGKFKLIKGLQ